MRKILVTDLYLSFFFSVLCLLCLCERLYICALWSPAEKGLTSRLSFVVSSYEYVTFPLVSWVRCGTWLYRFLIFAPLLTLQNVTVSCPFPLKIESKFVSNLFSLVKGKGYKPVTCRIADINSIVIIFNDLQRYRLNRKNHVPMGMGGSY